MELETINGDKFFIDDGDYHIVSQFRWTINKTIHKTGSVYRNVRTSNRPLFNGEKKYLSLARILMHCSDKTKQVDHIDGDSLNNRRANLRICSDSENKRNKGIYSNNTSGFKGIYKEGDIWRVSIRLNGKTIHGGRYINKEEAALAYNEMAKRYFGEFAYLNKV